MKLNPSKCVLGVSSGKFLGFMVSQQDVEANLDKIRAILEMTPPKNVKEVQILNERVATLNKFVLHATDKCLPFFKTLKKAFKELKAYLASPLLLSPFKPDKELSLYLAVSPTTNSSSLIWEEKRMQMLVYYTSRALRGGGGEREVPSYGEVSIHTHHSSP